MKVNGGDNMSERWPHADEKDEQENPPPCLSHDTLLSLPHLKKKTKPSTYVFITLVGYCPSFNDF